METIAIIFSALGLLGSIIVAAYKGGIESQKIRTLILQSETRLQRELTNNHEKTDKRIDSVEKTQAVHEEKISALERRVA